MTKWRSRADASLREFLSVREVAREFMMAYRSGLVEALGLILESLQVISGAVPSGRGPSRFVDLAWLIKVRGGGWLLVLVEVQNRPDADMVFRMLELVGRLRRDERCRFPFEGGTAQCWILPLVYYTGGRPWTVPTALEPTLWKPSPPSLRLMQPDFGYDVVDLHRLGAAGMPEALVFHPLGRLAEAAPKMRTPEGIEGMVMGVRRFSGTIASKQEIGDKLAPTVYNLFCIGADGEELLPYREFRRLFSGEKVSMDYLRGISDTLSYHIGLHHGKGLDEGIRKGRQEGILEGRISQMNSNMARRFGEDTAAAGAAVLAGISATVDLDAVDDLFWECSSGSEFLGRLERLRPANGRAD